MNTIAIMPTASGLTMSLPGKDKPIALSKTHANFEEVLEILRTGSGEEQASKILDLLEGPARKLEEALRDSELSTDVHIKDGVVTYKGKALNNYVTQKILELVRSGFPVTPVVRFLEKLMQNPIPRVINRLYQFLEHGEIPLTEDGDFVAYKVVRENFLDKHSGTMDNSPGQVVQMNRWEVDDDDNRTCSSGLHVCSYDYIKNFSSNGDRLVACLVNPINVVSIPTDYNNTKMRVCEYTVLRELPEFYKENKIDDVLASSPMFRTEPGSSDSFVIQVSYDSNDSFDMQELYFDNLVEAAKVYAELTERDSMHLRDLIDDGFESGLYGDFTVGLVNSDTGVVAQQTSIFVPRVDSDESSRESFEDEENDQIEYDFYVVTESGEREGFDSMLGALRLSKEFAADGLSGSIQDSKGQVLRRF